MKQIGGWITLDDGDYRVSEMKTMEYLGSLKDIRVIVVESEELMMVR